MKSVTVDDVLAQNPCDEYTRERIEELFAGRSSLTAPDVMLLDIPIEDRTWALNTCGLVPTRVCLEWIVECAEGVLPLFEDIEPGDTSLKKIVASVRKVLQRYHTPLPVEPADFSCWPTKAIYYRDWTASLIRIAVSSVEDVIRGGDPYFYAAPIFSMQAALKATFNEADSADHNDTARRVLERQLSKWHSERLHNLITAYERVF